MAGKMETAQGAWDSGRAKIMFERVLALQPNAVASLNGLGCLYLDAGKLAAARRELDKALCVQPANPVTCCNLAMVEFKEGAYDAARRLYSQALDIDQSNAVALCNLSDLLRRQPETRAEAYNLLERAMLDSPDNVHAMMSLSLLLAEDGRRAEAIEVVREAHELDPSDVPLATHYALLLEGRSFPQLPSLRETPTLSHHDATVRCDGGTASAPHPPAKNVGVQFDENELGVESEGRDGEEGEGCGHCPVEGPAPPSACEAAADDDEVVLRDVQAEEDECLSKPSSRNRPEQADVERASHILETALATGARSAGGRGDPSTAEAADAAVDADVLALSLLARMRREGGAGDATLGARLAQAAACKPRDPSTAAALARALMVGPYFDHDAALQLVEYAMKAHPSNAELVSAEAVALAMGGYDEAGDALEKALEMNPADVSCLASYGVWLKGEGDYEGAEAAYKAALRMTPGDPVIMVNMGALLEKWQGDWDMAHIWYKRALNIDPSNQRALLARGHIFENVFLDMDAAQDFYTQAGMRGHEPSLAAEGLWRAGLIHWQSFNDTCKAYGLFSRARMVDPTHTQGLHALAALEAQSGDVDEALTLCQDAVRLLPSDPDTVGELADLYQSAGRIDESESTYLATLKLRPTDVDAMKGYAHLLKHHRGQKAMAAQLFDMSKTLQADRERREELEQQQFDAVLSPPLLLLHLCATAPFPVLAPPTLTHAPPRMRFRAPALGHCLLNWACVLSSLSVSLWHACFLCCVVPPFCGPTGSLCIGCYISRTRTTVRSIPADAQ